MLFYFFLQSQQKWIETKHWYKVRFSTKKLSTIITTKVCREQMISDTKEIPQVSQKDSVRLERECVCVCEIYKECEQSEKVGNV